MSSLRPLKETIGVGREVEVCYASEPEAQERAIVLVEKLFLEVGGCAKLLHAVILDYERSTLESF